MKSVYKILSVVIILCSLFLIGGYFFKYANENKLLNQIVARLEAESRIAEVMVTGVNYDEKLNKNLTTIKFMEYDIQDNPLQPRYFTFSGNIIQFQSLVIRFDDIHIRRNDKLKGKSAYLFWKVFMLDKGNTQEYAITEVNEVPQGYRIDRSGDGYERKLWAKFWEYALDNKEAGKAGIKNAQIEAPGTMFVPGMIYTLKIEHDGGIRIDARPLPTILKGERIP